MFSFVFSFYLQVVAIFISSVGCIHTFWKYWIMLNLFLEPTNVMCYVYE